MSWKKVRVGDISSQIRGVSYSKDEASLVPKEGCLPILRANNITEHGLVFEDLVYVPKARINQKQQIKQGDIVIAASSGSIQVVGKAGYANDDFEGSFGAFCKVLRPSKEVYPKFFSYYFQTPTYRSIISNLAAGANINNLKNEHLDDLEIPLPPLDEQKRIAQVLDKANRLRQKDRQLLAHYDQLLQSVFLDMFGDPVKNEKGWEVISLTDVCTSKDDIRCGPFGTQLLKSEFRHEGVPLWGIKHVNKGFLLQTNEFLTEEKAAELKNYDLVPGDIVMTRKGTVGNCSVYPLDFDCGIMHSDLLRIRVNRELCNSEFLSFQLKISRDVEHQISIISSGAIMAGINVSKLKQIKVQLPPVDLQNKFSASVTQIVILKSNAVKNIELSESLFQSLLQKAFKGELQMKELKEVEEVSVKPKFVISSIL